MGIAKTNTNNRVCWFYGDNQGYKLRGSGLEKGKAYQYDRLLSF